jgi:hypothetical protein
MGQISTRIVDGPRDAAMKSAFDRWERDIYTSLTHLVRREPVPRALIVVKTLLLLS